MAQHWTDTYNKWSNWQDPDEVAKKREEEEKRARSYRENHMSCNHDRSAERKVMDMPIEEKILACREFRHRGNLFHAEGQYRRGALQYRQALIYYDFCFPDDESQQQELDEIHQACLLNSAACFLACGELDQTLNCCYQALRAEPNNVKALYRRAVVYRLRDQFKEASVDLGRALAQRPNEVVLRKESAVLKSKIASYKERRRSMVANIFGKDQQQDRHQDRDQDQVDDDHTGDQGPLFPPKEQIESQIPGGNDKTSPHWAEGDDPSIYSGPAAGRKETAGVYAVAATIGLTGLSGMSRLSGRGEQEGKRRHDLELPVGVDLSQLEAMAGCAWPSDP